MKATFANLEGLERKIEITFDQTEVAAAIDVQARKLAKEVKLPGGYTKTTTKMARLKQIPAFRKQIGYHAVEELVETAAREGFQELTIKTIGRPELDSMPEIESFSKPLTIGFLAEERPEPEKLEYSKLEISALDEIEVSEDDIDAAVNEQIGIHTKYEDVNDDDVLDVGDLTLITNELKVDGEVVQVAQTGSVAVVAGSEEEKPPAFFKELAAKLPGMKKGDKDEFDFDWPDAETEDEAVRGKLVNIQFTIGLARKKVVPELTEEFVKETLKEESIETLRQSLAEKLKERKISEAKMGHMTTVIEAIVKANEIAEPTRMIEHQLNETLEKRKNEEKEISDDEKATLRKDIAFDISKHILLSLIMEAEKIEPDPEKAMAETQKMMGHMDQNDPNFSNMMYSAYSYMLNMDVEMQVYDRIMELHGFVAKKEETTEETTEEKKEETADEETETVAEEQE